MRTPKDWDRGTALISYALLVGLISLVGMVGMSYAGGQTSDKFSEIGAALASTLPGQPELTPEEKWDLAQANYDKAISDATAKKSDELAKAKADYDAAIEANKSLPKESRKEANQVARDQQNATKAQAQDDFKTTTDAAKATKAQAKADYNASKKKK